MIKNNGEVDEITGDEPVDITRLRKIPYDEWIAERKTKGLPIPNLPNLKFKGEDEK